VPDHPQAGACGWRTISGSPHADAVMNSDKNLSDAERSLRDAALEYHRLPSRGKVAVNPTKAL